jgi:uncharacterized YccA/Bax inhibitor family protein
MNIAMLISAIVAFFSPLLARRGVFLPPAAAGWVAAIFTFVSGLVSNGLKEPRTTIIGAIGGAITGAVAAFGADPGTQTAFSGLFLTMIAWLTRSPLTPTPAPVEIR